MRRTVPTRPDFLTLEAMSGHPELRLVDGAWMEREQYDAEGWMVVGEYPNVHGELVSYWKASLDGLRRYGQLQEQRKQERIAAWRTRNERDDEFKEYVDGLEDQRPGGYVSRRPE